MYVSNLAGTRESQSFWTIPQIAAHCQVSTKTVRRWIVSGELVAHRLGRQWRISEKDLDTFLKIRRQG